MVGEVPDCPPRGSRHLLAVVVMPVLVAVVVVAEVVVMVAETAVVVEPAVVAVNVAVVVVVVAAGLLAPVACLSPQTLSKTTCCGGSWSIRCPSSAIPGASSWNRGLSGVMGVPIGGSRAAEGWIARATLPSSPPDPLKLPPGSS